jgi:hypothetical protein
MISWRIVNYYHVLCTIFLYYIWILCIMDDLNVLCVCRYPVDRVPCVHALRQDGEQDTHPRAATCPTALDPTSLSSWALTLPRVLWLWTPPYSWDGIRRCYVSRGSGPCLSAEVGSSAATCPEALDPQPCWEGLRCWHVSSDSLSATGLTYKERHS